MDFTLVFLLILTISNLVAIIYMTFVQRRSVGATLAWLLIFFFLPVVGFVLYFFLGSTYKIKIFSKKYRLPDIENSYVGVVEKQINALNDDKIDFKDSKIDNYASLILANANNNLCHYTDDNSVKIYTSAKDKYEQLMKDIENAKESIHLLYFIFNSKSTIGKKFIKLLAKKAKEGVEVRLIYDRFGCLKTRKKDFQSIIDAGGEVYEYLPSFFKTIAQVNYRMHRKIVVIDGLIAYTGGINISDEYLGKHKRIKPWRDSAIRMCGSAVITMQLRFISDFIFLDNQYHKNKKTKYHLTNAYQVKKLFPLEHESGHVGMQIVASGPDGDIASVKDGYLKMINLAKEYIYIETPYFVPDESLLDGLRLACASGVDVRVILPGVPDKQYAYWVTLSYLQELLSWGVKVYFYNGFMHAKMIVIDDIVSTVGTTNFDIRSFALDYEINAFIYDEDIGKECKEIFMNDLKEAKELNYEEYKKRPNKAKFFEGVCKLFSPLV